MHRLLRLLLFVLMPAACNAAGTSPLSQPEAVLPAARTEPPVTGGVCVDATPSMPAAVAAANVEATAAFVEGWVPLVDDHLAGTDPVPGLELILRRVIGGSSLAPDGYVRTVRIPGVPSVMPRPGTDDPHYAELLAEWRAQATAADRALASARAAAAAEAEAVRSSVWAAPSSEVAGCLEALALTVKGANRRLAVLSDLLQVGRPQVGLARYDGAHVLVVHNCVEVDVCLSQQRSWDQALRARGAAEVAFARPEEIGSVLPAFLRNPRS